MPRPGQADTDSPHDDANVNDGNKQWGGDDDDSDKDYGNGDDVDNDPRMLFPSLLSVSSMKQAVVIVYLFLWRY